MIPSAEDPETPICSAKGCRAPAVWVLAWNNPKLHTPDRRKTWLACGEHRESLASFLGMRDFLKEMVPLEEWNSRPATPKATEPETAGPDAAPDPDKRETGPGEAREETPD